MHFGIEIVPFGEFAEAQNIVRLAQAAEAAGWEALWVWDHLAMPYGVADPWVTLTAVAANTSTLKILPGVAALPRYKPHLLARLLASLDRLSNGRFILGAGLGAIHGEFANVGENSTYQTRAAMLDEMLDLLAAFATGEPVTHHGPHYNIDNLAILPPPLQQPRYPVWIGGDSPAAYRRAARWDGWIIGTINENSKITLPPEALAQRVAAIQRLRLANLPPLAFAVDGISQPGETALAKEYAAAGATWWFEVLFGLRGSIDELLARVQAGPPRW